jgi:hypothetical protein
MSRFIIFQFVAVIGIATAARSALAQDPAQTAPVAPAPTVLQPEGAPSAEPTPAPPADVSRAVTSGAAGDAMYAEGPFAHMLGANVGHLQPRIDYRATWFPDETVSGQGTRLGYVDQSLSVSVPVWQDLVDEVSASLSVRDETFHTGGTVLPTSHLPFPDDLWNIRAGASYRHLFDNGWIAGGSLSLGSASDRPFHGIDEMFVGVNAFLRVPQGEHNAWLFSLSYSPTGELPYPIPGVAYVWRPNDYFQLNIGLPFALIYRPTEDVTFDFSYMLLRTVHARVSYRMSPTMRAYVGFDWENESYFLADSPDVNDRFYYFDMRLSAGMQFVLPRRASLDVSGGYVFERYYFQGVNSNDSNVDRVNIGAGPFLGLRAGLRF